MKIIQLSDFTGPFQLVQDPKTDKSLQSFIDLYEVPTLRKLLGQELADLLIATLVSGVPVGQRYLDIFNPFIADDWRESKGIKVLLLASVYYQFVTDNQVKYGQSGFVGSQDENSNVLSPRGAMRIGESRWNEIVETADTIQVKCLTESDTYPEYNGNEKYFKVKYGSLV